MYRQLEDEFDVTFLATNRSLAAQDVAIVGSPHAWLEKIPLIPKSVWAFLLGRVFPLSDRVMGMGRYLEQADLVHTVELLNPVSVQVAARRRRRNFKHVVTVWENLPRRFEGRRGVAAARRAVLESADELIAVTERARSALLLEGAAAEKVSVVPPGVARLKADATVREEQNRGLRLLFVGKKQRSKGVFELLCAFKLLLEDAEVRAHEIRLTFLGSQPSRGPYRGLIKEWNLAPQIAEIPFVPYDEVGKYYAEADAVVVPSRLTEYWQEQFGMVFVEAMELGLPIVTTDSGSIREVVGEAGLYARPNDHHSLYECLRRLLVEEGLRTRLGAAGRARRERFSLAEVATALKKVYWRALGRTHDSEGG